MNILVIGPSWVGDMMMSHALYQQLKIQYPECEIDVMAPDWCRPLLARMPEVRKAISMPIGHGAFALSKRFALGKSLQNQYDMAIVLPNSLKSALIPFFARIPVRRGWKGEMRYGLLNDLRKNKNAYPMMVQRYLALAYEKDAVPVAENLSLPKPSLQANPNALAELIAHADIPLGERQNAQGEWLPDSQFTTPQQQVLGKMLKQACAQNRTTIGFCSGAEFGPAKRWPHYHYAELAQRLIKQGYQIYLFGSAKDEAVGEEIRNSLPESARGYCFNFAGKTNLEQAIDLIYQCAAVVSNDSGLMHIAAALNRPLVALYGPTSPAYTPPLADNAVIIRLIEGGLIKVRKGDKDGGYHQSLIDIQPVQVVEKLNELLQR